MAIQTSTTWSADDYDEGNYRHAELEREPGPSTSAVLVVGTDKMLLNVDQLRELSTAAARIADEIEASK